MRTVEGYDVKIFTDNVEETALSQIRELLSIDVVADKKIRIMPDVHAGAGCVIGFTGNLGDKVIPNIVGVDLRNIKQLVVMRNCKASSKRCDNNTKSQSPRYHPTYATSKEHIVSNTSTTCNYASNGQYCHHRYHYPPNIQFQDIALTNVIPNSSQRGTHELRQTL